MRMIVETTGDFQLVDAETGFLVRFDRPSVPPVTSFIQAMAGSKLRILGNVSDEATDEEFEVYLKESGGDVKLAMASFISAFPDPDTKAVEPEPEVKPKKAK